MKSSHKTKINLFIGFGSILAILALLTGIWLSHVKQNSTRLANLVKDQHASELIFTMRDAARNRTMALFRMAVIKDPFEQEDEFDYLLQLGEVFIKAHAELRSQAMNENEKNNWDVELRKLIRQGSISQREAAELIRDSNIAQAEQVLLYKLMPTQNKVMSHLTVMLERQKQKVASELAAAANHNRTVYITISILGSVALLIASFITFLIIKITTKSEQDLTIARDNAQSANNQKSFFLANMSHELRTPLNAIIGYSEMLQEQAQDRRDENLMTDLDKIHLSGHHLLSLIDDILDLSKLEANKMEIYPETFDLHTLINEVVGTITPLMAINNNTLEVSGDQNSQVYSDARKIRQTLLNLLSNAGKFTNQGRISVTISEFTQDNMPWIKIEIEDNGIGITEQQLEKLFTPFAQADASTTRKFGGTGLGLYISKHYCNIMKGQLSVESQLHKGSKFTVTIPKNIEQSSVLNLVA